MKKSKILFILHLPEPVHGASVMGRYIKESKIINNEFGCDYINISTSTQLQGLGKPAKGNLVRFLKMQFKIIKLLIVKRYQLCYVTISAEGVGFYKDIFIVAILKLFRKKIIYHFHTKGVSSRQNKTLDHLLYKFTFHNSKIILLSPFLYDDIKKYVKKEDVFFCANGIPQIAHSSSLQKKEVGDTHHCNLLFLSNMMIEKGVLVLLDACKILKQKGFVFECHFIGNWFDISEEQFNERLRMAGLAQNVFAHGKKYGAEKLSFFNDADIFIFPTFYHKETFGLVILEAMQFALPVITTPEGGIPDVIVDGQTGFLVPQQNINALAEKIELLIKTPELRFQMGMAGKKRYDDLFTLDKFENRLLNILKEAIAKN